MKNQPLRFSATFLFLFFSTIAFPQDILWERSLGGKQADYLTDAQPTADFGFILAGSSLSGKSGNKAAANKGDLDYAIWKMDEAGEAEWQKSFGGPGSDLLQSVALTSDGGFVLAGISSSNKGFDKKEDSRGQDDFWIIRLDASGSEEWQATIGGTMQEKLHSIKQTRDGGFIVAGSSSSNKSGEKTTNGFGNLDYWVVKLDRKGKIEWDRTFGGIYADELRSIDVTSDGGYILGGSSNSPYSGNKTANGNGAGDYWVLKLDAKGEVQWEKTFGGEGDDQLYVVRQTYDKGYILGGNSRSGASGNKSTTNSEGTDFWLVKLDGKGDVLWQQTYNFGNYDILTSIVENPDHTLLVGGFAKGEVNGNRLGRKAKSGTDDYIALKLNEGGQEIWSGSVGSDGEDILRKVIETRDGGYVFTGTSNPQARPSDPGAQKRKGGALGGISYSNGKNKAVQDARKDINRQIGDTANEANQYVKDNATTATNKVKDGLGMDKDSPLKMGVNDSANPLSLGKVGDGKAGNDPLSALGGGPALPRSGDKKRSYGNSDFWVVKLLDKSKPKPEKPTIEAYPNPAAGFTNVIVGYEFETGTATVVDLGGRVLQSFEISSRTVPVDLSAYPEGIYIVNIRTNVQSDGVKVMKKTVKN